MKRRGREGRREEEEEADKCIIQPVGSVKANFPDAKWDRMTGFWLQGDYFCLLLWKTVCVKTTCQWWKHSMMPKRPNSSGVSFLYRQKEKKRKEKRGSKFCWCDLRICRLQLHICIIQAIILAKALSCSLRNPASLYFYIDVLNQTCLKLH